ncbi:MULTISPECIES: DUF5685 family protein [Pseudofrankia]|uniref:DUF5685 family protein n=1 Tax=Pseudofrankia TaxID=2994363 RepID=UPI000234CE86|nr:MULTISPECIES: DUF5685 family protein [Pseudofrankia]OHV36387.1 hypothetical protein BCD49_19200 [Pseudofrankia sp. EUN1h]
MFGILRPCRHRLGEDLTAVWMSHLCGMCLTLRDRQGHWARAATNVDGLVLSVLVAAQTGEAATRKAGPCALRGLRTAEVATRDDPGAMLAAAVSLTAAATNVDDHVADGDGPFARRPVAALAGRFAGAAARGGASLGAELSFDVDALARAAGRQQAVEAAAGPGTALTAVTAPAEEAASRAFAHTAALAGRPGNAEPLAEVGRLFGRLAHLVDAVADQVADDARDAWNPLTATGTTLAQARALCDDALLGIALALRDVEFAPDPGAPARTAARRNRHARLAHLLLVHELELAVDNAFRGAQPQPGRPPGPGRPGGPGGPGPGRPGRRVTLPTCLAAAGMFCTCQMCCGHYTSPFDGQQKQGICSGNCGDCGDCGDCCQGCGDCCDCCDGCDGCDCGC